jgi:hypothetical protein
VGVGRKKALTVLAGTSTIAFKMLYLHRDGMATGGAVKDSCEPVAPGVDLHTFPVRCVR